MDKQKLIVGGIIITLLLIGSFLLPNDQKIGSTPISGEYKYTHLTGSVASTTADIKAEAGTLGSIIITEDSAAAITIYDATSTQALSGGTSYFKKIGVLQAALTEGTYTFDVSFNRGLVLSTTDWTAFAGDFTVTWR